MKKVLLVHPGRLYAPTWGIEIWTLRPLLVNLFSYLRQEKELDIDTLDLELEMGNPSTKEQVAKFKGSVTCILRRKDFDIVAISCYLSTNYLSTKMVAEICRKVNKKSIIVVGGHHASAVPSDFLYKNNPFDFIVIGEGEEVLLKICKGEIKTEGYPQVIHGAPLNLKKSFPLRLKEFKYTACQPVHTVGFELSRGCIFNCSYCPEHVLNSSWRSYSVKDSIKKIERAIDSISPLRIGFMDPCFGIDKAWRRNLLSEIIKRKINRMFWALPRIEILEKEDINLFAKLNFLLDISLESGSGKILGIMERTKNPKAYLKKCRAVIGCLNDKKIPHNLFIVFNHPGEDLDTFRETLRYVWGLIKGRKCVSTRIIAQPFYVIPGTPAFAKLDYFKKRYGTFVKYKKWWKEESGDQFVLATDVIASNGLKDINPYSYYKNDLDKLRDLLICKLSKERISFDFALEKIMYEKDKRRNPYRSSGIYSYMYMPEFLFTR